MMCHMTDSQQQLADLRRLIESGGSREEISKASLDFLEKMDERIRELEDWVEDNRRSR